jgi:hypothetical protein
MTEDAPEKPPGQPIFTQRVCWVLAATLICEGVIAWDHPNRLVFTTMCVGAILGVYVLIARHKNGA